MRKIVNFCGSTDGCTECQARLLDVGRRFCYNIAIGGLPERGAPHSSTTGEERNDMDLSTRIVRLRRARGWSQEELAQRLNVSRQSVSKWESGSSTPDLDRVVAMCALFGITADEMLRADGAPCTAESGGAASESGAPRPVMDGSASSERSAICPETDGGAASENGAPRPVMDGGASSERSAICPEADGGALSAGGGCGQSRAGGEAVAAIGLDEAYRYAATCQSTARMIARGVAACIFAPAPLCVLDGLGELLGSAVGLPVMLLLVAYAVWQFIEAAARKKPYEALEKGRAAVAPDVVRWARAAQAQFRPQLARGLAAGVALCVASIVPVGVCDGLAAASATTVGAEFLENAGVAGMLALVAAGVCLIVRSGLLTDGYKKLLQAQDARPGGKSR